HMPEIRRIKRHRHVPKQVKKAGEIKGEELKSIKRRRENERKHNHRNKTKNGQHEDAERRGIFLLRPGPWGFSRQTNADILTSDLLIMMFRQMVSPFRLGFLAIDVSHLGILLCALPQGRVSAVDQVQVAVRDGKGGELTFGEVVADQPTGKARQQRAPILPGRGQQPPRRSQLGILRAGITSSIAPITPMAAHHYTLYLCGHVVYNIYFHPLAKFPGPKFYAATHLPYFRDIWTGTGAMRVKLMHDKYGDTVRISPNSLAFNTAQAFKDIYGQRIGKKQLPKDRDFYRTEPDAHQIIFSNDADHSRMRRLLSHAFSEQALREQEPIIKQYIDLLMQKLHQQVAGPGGGKVNVVEWFNFATFDIIGDLSFGQPFGSLESGDYHFWIASIFRGLKFSRVYRIGNSYPYLGLALNSFISLAPQMSGRAKHMQYSQDATNKRMARKTDRRDFMTYVLRHNDEKGMTLDEIKKSFDVVLIAGSETTATMLSGTTYHLMNNKPALQRLAAEIRAAFNTEEDITILSTSKLHYLNAVIQEGLRIYPPVPTILPRYTLPEGDVINGHFIPGNTQVGVSHWASTHSLKNFRDPYKFVPERWLDDPRYADDNKAALQPFSLGPRNCIGK
ncbi:MAG: hypothetical protein Q9187_008323, partial [Circinaria calcarea]